MVVLHLDGSRFGLLVVALTPVSATALLPFHCWRHKRGRNYPKGKTKALSTSRWHYGLVRHPYLMVYITRAWILPAIPTELILFGDFSLTKGTALMLLFAIMMLWAGRGMIKDPEA